MAIQTINLGTQPNGAGGDTNRSANVKINENFTNPIHAASRMVGRLAGSVMEVGAFGLGYRAGEGGVGFPGDGMDLNAPTYGFFANTGSGAPPLNNPLDLTSNSRFAWVSFGAINSDLQICAKTSDKKSIHFRCRDHAAWVNAKWYEFLTSANTTIDANGFLKTASPVAQLFATMIKLNAEAAEQNPIFEKVDTGHYLIKGTQGFATEGWWIEVPADTNGNKICAVQYQTLENGDLEIKTFKKKLNDEGDIVPNLDAPIDIPNNTNGEPRWIDIRLNPLPAKPIIEQVPRTEKRPKMVKQIKYAPQLTYITKMQDLIDDEGNPVIVKGQPFQAPVSYVHTDQNGTPILTSQPVINDNGENIFELVQVVDADGQPVFEDVPVLDDDGMQIFDEVTYGPEQ